MWELLQEKFDMRLYYSTGGSKTTEQINNIVESPFGIEFSGGKYREDITLYLSNFKNKRFQFHNYFPVPKQDIVLNLSSESEEIQNESIQAYKNAIDLSCEHGLEYFSLHAGFLIDPKPNELGKIKNNSNLIPYKIGLENFAKNINSIASYASDKGVQILVENNVTSKTTLRRFGCSPLLFTDLETSKDILSILPEKVGILCDLAHLKVSSNVLGFKIHDVMDIISNITYGVHLSQNDQFEDTNKTIIGHTWFIKYLHMLNKAEFLTLETYDYSMETIMNQYEELQRIFS